jgi:putative ABC transport system permease protein
MLYRDAIRLSLHNLFLHKVRSLLTSLGIIFGVGSVIAMLAISEGARFESLAQIEAMGIDNILISSRKPPIVGKDESQNESRSFITAYGLTNKDLENIRKMDNILRITTLRDARKRVMRGSTRLDVRVVSVDPSFLEDTQSEITHGRWLSEFDSARRATVCVLGREARRQLFQLGAGNILGESVRAQEGVFTVVGVLENNLGVQLSDFPDLNNLIYIPDGATTDLFGYNAFQRERRSAEVTTIEFDLLLVKVVDTAYLDDTAKRIRGYLETAHGDNPDWSVFVPLDLFRQHERTQRIFAIVMGSIAGISLLVGGIGIMNIMLANVYERRKEIGTRRALGARKSDILNQFLIETVTLTSLGGLLGICVGVGISRLVTYYADWPIRFPPWILAASYLIAAAIGIVFGTYPAWKAAQQNPIDVLRAE